MDPGEAPTPPAIVGAPLFFVTLGALVAMAATFLQAGGHGHEGPVWVHAPHQLLLGLPAALLFALVLSPRRPGDIYRAVAWAALGMVAANLVMLA